MRWAFVLILVAAAMTIPWLLMGSQRGHGALLRAELIDVAAWPDSGRSALAPQAFAFIVVVPASLSDVAPEYYRGYLGQLRALPGNRSFWLAEKEIASASGEIRLALGLAQSDLDEVRLLMRRSECALEIQLSVFSEEHPVAESTWMSATELFRSASARFK